LPLWAAISVKIWLLHFPLSRERLRDTVDRRLPQIDSYMHSVIEANKRFCEPVTECLNKLEAPQHIGPGVRLARDQILL
jgi:hypothetical protein